MRFSIRQLLCGVAVVAALLAAISVADRPKQFGRIFNYVSSVRFSPDGTRLAVVLGRAQDAQVPLKGYVANVGDTAAILNAKDLAHGTIIAHQYRDGRQGPNFGLMHLSEFTADSKQVVLFENRKQAEWWDIAVGKWSKDPPDFGSDVRFFHFSPAGNAVVVYKETGIEIREMPSNKLAFPQTDWSSIAFSPDGKLFANLTRKDGVQIWDFDERKLLHTFHEGHDELDTVSSITFSPDGDTIAFRCREGLRIYRMSTESEQVLLPEFFEPIHTATGWGEKTHTGEATRGIAFTADSCLLAAWGAYGLKFFDAKHNFRLKSSDANAKFNCLSFAPDGKRYVTGDSEGAVTVWDTQTRMRVKSVVLNGWADKDSELVVEASTHK